MPNLTKRDLVVRISDETKVTQGHVFVIVQKTLDYITEALTDGQTIELRNFGVFEVRLTKPRVGRNPNAPEKDVLIPERATVKFKAGKMMRESVLKQTLLLKKGASAKKGAAGKAEVKAGKPVAKKVEPAVSSPKKPVKAEVPAKAVPVKASVKAVPAKAVPAKTVPVKAVPAKAVPAKVAPAKVAATSKKGAKK